jgi:hypothetical protein
MTGRPFYCTPLSCLTPASLFFIDDRFSQIAVTTIMPMTMPVRTERSMTTARDASKCQDKKVTEIGMAFCTEKTATREIMIIMNTTVSKVTSRAC